MDTRKARKILLKLSDTQATACQRLRSDARNAVPRSLLGQSGSYQEGDLEREISYELAQLAQGQHRAIADALKRLEQGKYGLCEHCDVKIDDARLNAIPSAKRCRACQEAVEEKSPSLGLFATA